MTVELAFQLLGISRECTLQELNNRFRKLAKKYHPDASGADSAESHENMTLLNLAFETALEFLEMKAYVAETRGGAPEPAAPERAQSGRAQAPGPSQQSIAGAEKAVNDIRDAIFVYYQYGLENVHQRTEGTGRFRYRESLRKIKSGLSRLESVIPDFPPSKRLTALTAFHGFAHAFQENMLISRFYIPTPLQVEANGYRHYRAGGTCLDLAIKDLFCAELASGRAQRHFTSDNLQLIEKELMAVLTHYYSSSWITETLIKMKLFEQFITGLKSFTTFL